MINTFVLKVMILLCNSALDLKVISCSPVSVRKHVWGTGRQKQRRVYRNVWMLHASTWSSVSLSQLHCEMTTTCSSSRRSRFCVTLRTNTDENTTSSVYVTIEANSLNLFPLGKEPGVFDVVIINDDLERAYKELKEILNEVGTRTGLVWQLQYRLLLYIHGQNQVYCSKY